LYATYDFDFGLSLGITDYYFPVEDLKLLPDSVIKPVRLGSYFDYQGHHYFEASITQRYKGLYASFYYGFHNLDQAVYAELGYEYEWLTFFAGAGNKLYSQSGKFNLVNVGVKAQKEIRIAKNYSIALFSSVILNPNAEQIHLVFGVGL
jgi:hypothetical protein